MLGYRGRNGLELGDLNNWLTFTALLINLIEKPVVGGGRVRHQPGATSARTLQDITEAEGQRLRKHIYRKAEAILQEQELNAQGKLVHQENNQKLNESLSVFKTRGIRLVSSGGEM